MQEKGLKQVWIWLRGHLFFTCFCIWCYKELSYILSSFSLLFYSCDSSLLSAVCLAVSTIFESALDKDQFIVILHTNGYNIIANDTPIVQTGSMIITEVVYLSACFTRQQKDSLSHFLPRFLIFTFLPRVDKVPACCIKYTHLQFLPISESSSLKI